MIAAKRLHKEIQSLRKNPLPGIGIQPKEDNILEWDGAILIDVPNHGQTAMHFLIVFSEDYPNKAPLAGFSCEFNYQDGAGYFENTGPLAGKFSICLNILGNFASYHKEWGTTVGEGWSAASRIDTLLVQLQAILLSSMVDEVKNKKLYTDCEEYRKTHELPPIEGFNFSGTTNNAKAPVCPFPSFETESIPEEIKAQCMAIVEKIGDNPEIQKKFVAIIEQLMLNRNGNGYEDLVHNPEIMCWYSQSHYTEDVLGFGIVVNQGKSTAYTDGDLISWTSYKMRGLRQLPNKQTFQRFLPVWINRVHATENPVWQAVMTESITSLGRDLNCLGQIDSILKIFPDSINTMIVRMMDDRSDISAGIKIFQCIMNYWRCFYYFVETNATLRSRISTMVKNFIQFEHCRRKERTPNIGWMLTFVSVLPREEIDFGQFMTVYHDESFLRKVYWWQKDMIELTPESTFAAGDISHNHSLFQFLFFDMILGDDKTTLLKELERTNCLLPERMENFLKKWKEVQSRMKANKTWEQFYSELCLMGLPEIKKDAMVVNMQEEIFSAVEKAESLKGYTCPERLRRRPQLYQNNYNYYADHEFAHLQDRWVPDDWIPDDNEW